MVNAQVAELVDALVSNTNGFGRAGSTPALGTIQNEKEKEEIFILILFLILIVFLFLYYWITMEELQPILNPKSWTDLQEMLFHDSFNNQLERVR